MIKRIVIDNMKSILHKEIEVGNLNLFTGVNGSGKSSFLQSILLLRQSYLSGNINRKPASINLSAGDSLVNVGTYKDFLCQLAEKENERVRIKIDFEEDFIEFISDEYNSDNKSLNYLNGKLNKEIDKILNQSLFSDRFQYLGAERIEPKEDYPRFQFNELLGKKGEFTANYLEKYGSIDVELKSLCLSLNPSSYSLINLTNEWMSEICGEIEIITEENLNTNKIELSYRYKYTDGSPTQKQKPQNVGFGITHTLPIVVAILSSKPNDIIIIENPETHLHPRGQSRLSCLIAKAASNGVQIFIETHSDHIINGLRVAAKKKIIEPEQIHLHYFSLDKYKLTQIENIKFQSDGGLNIWPVGFFDEWDLLLNELL